MISPISDHRRHYKIIRTPGEHYIPAHCEEVDCEHHKNGWATIVDESTTLGQGQAHYIRTHRRGEYKENRTPEGLTAFLFSPGRRCFTEHQKILERPPLYIAGDRYRQRRHRDALDWIEDFTEHTDTIL